MKIGMPQLYEFDTIEDNLKLAKNLGLDFIELNLNFGYCRKEMEASTVAALLEKYGLEATLHFYDEADFGIYPEVVDAYLKLLEKYAKLGKGYIKQLNIHNQRGPVVTISGVKNYIYEKEFKEYINRLIDNLNKVYDICKENDINLVIENTDDLASYMSKTYLYEKNAGFKFCYDIGHDNINKNILWDVNQILDLEFKEFHIHDGDGKRCHLALGEGNIDIAKFKKMALKNDAYVVLEVKQASDLIKSVPIFKNL